MAFCPQCGAEATGNFCPRCGASVAGVGSTTEYTTTSAGAGTAAVTSTGLSENWAGVLCYVLGLVTGIIFLVLAPYNQSRFVRFHAFQSIFFHVGLIVLYIGLGIVGALMGIVTHGLSALFSLFLYPLLMLGSFVLWLYLMYSAYQHKKVLLPIIGPLAEKQA